VALLVSHLRWLSCGRVSLQVISHSLTSISDNTRLLPQFTLSSSLRSIGSREGGNIESEAWGWSRLAYSSNKFNKRAYSTIEADKD
jgi:hypothetical protein